MQQTTHKQAPRLKFIAILAAATSVILVLTLTPWNIVPTLVTEDVTVIAVTNDGCVAESILGHSVVVPNCGAGVGDVISASFYVPAMEVNGFYDRIQDKLATVNP
ncbi:MAG: hypothetical protein HKM23_07400 [Nitrosopumilus sp.]|nr:hypothetical protein [Nitrosopumilus sp.]